MMNNSLPKSDCQPIGESISQYMQQKKRGGQTPMTTNTETKKENDDQEIITQVENVVASTTDKTINENSVTLEQRSCESDVEKKPTKDHGGTIKLMQGMKESDKDSEESSIPNDETKISKTSTNYKRGRAKNSISWTILCGSKNPLITRKISRSKRESGSNMKVAAGSTFKLRKNPIPAKEWVWIYHRRLIRQNAFCDTWPEN